MWIIATQNLDYGKQSEKNYEVLSLGALLTLQNCSENFPPTKILLQIFSTLPLSSACGQISFSIPRLIKSHCGSTMNQKISNRLLNLSIHRGLLGNQRYAAVKW